MTGTPNSLITPQVPLVGKCKLTAANTAYDAPTAAVQLLPGQTNGARITKVQFTLDSGFGPAASAAIVSSPA